MICLEHTRKLKGNLQSLDLLLDSQPSKPTVFPVALFASEATSPEA